MLTKFYLFSHCTRFVLYYTLKDSFRYNDPSAADL